LASGVDNAIFCGFFVDAVSIVGIEVQEKKMSFGSLLELRVIYIDFELSEGDNEIAVGD
jgi:hypothetical protein